MNVPIVGQSNNKNDAEWYKRLEDIYIKKGRFLYLDAYRILRDHEQAQDNVQDVFRIMLGKQEQYKNTNVVAVLRKSITCAAIDEYRKRKKRTHESLDADETQSLEQEVQEKSQYYNQESILDQIIDNEEEERLLDLLHRELRPLYFQIVLLRYISHSRDEICKILECSLSTVERAMHKAREITQRYLNDND